MHAPRFLCRNVKIDGKIDISGLIYNTAGTHLWFGVSLRLCRKTTLLPNGPRDRPRASFESSSRGSSVYHTVEIARTRTAVSLGVGRLSEGCYEDLLIYGYVYG